MIPNKHFACQKNTNKGKKRIIDYINHEKEKFKEYLNTNKITDNIFQMSKQEFNNNEVLLNL